MPTKKQIIPIILSTAIQASAAPAPQASSGAQPISFTANPNVGPGGASYKDSDHFRLYSSDQSNADAVLTMLEAAYSCYVGDLGWTTSGIPYNADPSTVTTLWKENVYEVNNLGSAAGVQKSDPNTGLSWLEVVPSSLADPRVTVHEYGHALTYHSRNWVDQTATGAWWETVANWVADTFNTSPLCAKARSNYNQPTGDTMIELKKVIGDSFQVIVDGSTGSGNYYQAWPFLTYLTNNPDNYAGLGSDVVRQLFQQYEKGSNETPLHTLARVSTAVSVQEIVGRYWARMAYVDIGHTVAQEAFLNQRNGLNYANVDPQGDGVYVVKSFRKPQYMGANILPLSNAGAGNLQVSITSNGVFSATLAIRNTNTGAVRYVSLENGSGAAVMTGNEEASVVIANTPKTLYQYDAFKLTPEVQQGLDYTIKISGATVQGTAESTSTTGSTTGSTGYQGLPSFFG
ncbi:hypothetical protein BDV34DRAFT_215935 [Aspergillus parasiticus]|uniref:Uncharacterized protein n=1 Tax=Aspergillus parasiticus TaxID=5067 RepID=A0A5N6DAC7_ASPPA|nr:hypothetical protein BDV34DRAFT_215935 [Aspergillus parasiticus]